MTTIKDRVRIILAGSPIISGVFTREWPLHGWTHENGGVDEISVDGLDGLLADPQDAGWFEGIPLDDTGLGDGDVYVYNQSTGNFELVNVDTIGGVLSLSINDDNQRLIGHLRLTEGTNILLDPLDDGTGYQISALVADVPFYPSAQSIVAGTDIGTGDYTDLDTTHHDGGGEIEIQEDVGSPGIDVRFTISSVTAIDKAKAYVWYDAGVTAHTVQFQIYNYTTTAWVTLDSVGTSNAYEVMDVAIISDTDYINGSGESQVRFYHPSAGIATHDLHIDYVALVRASTTAGGVTDHGALTGLTDIADHPYAFLHDGTRAATGDFDMDNHAIGDINYLGFHLNGVTLSEGQLGWDSDNGVPACGLPGGNVTMQIGQELPFRSWNQSGVNLLNGNACRIVGATGNLPSIAISGLATDAGGCVFGLCTENINTGSNGYVTALGIVNGLNTSAFSSGDELWLTSSGQWVGVQPDAPFNANKIGFVIRSHATEGSIYVRPQRIPRYNNLQDVNVRDQTLYTGNITAWNATEDYWDVLTDFFIRYDGSDYIIETDVGTLVFDDEYRATSTTFTSRLSMAASQAEWDALGTTLGGPQSLVYILNQALTSGGGTLDAAYDYGGSGSGRIITADTGAVRIQNDDNGVNFHVLRATEATGHYDLVQITNPDEDAADIRFYGTAGTTDIFGEGHTIQTVGGSQTLKASLTSSQLTYEGATMSFSSHARNIDGTYVGEALVKSIDDSSNYAELSCRSTAAGATGAYLTSSVLVSLTAADVNLTATDDIVIDAADDLHLEAVTADIEATTSVDINAPELDMNDTPTLHDAATASYSSGTITVNWTTGKYGYVEITGDATTVTMTAPTSETSKFTGPYVLEIAASGAARTFTGFSGVDWTEPYNPDSVAQPIPAGEICVVQLYYRGTLGHGGYLGTVHPQS